ncbi:hypothetical protein CRG98_050106, partial [Punica granatum]
AQILAGEDDPDKEGKKKLGKQGYLVEGEITAKPARELLDAVNGDFGGVVQVIDYDDPETTEKELEHRVTPNVAGASGHQYARGHFQLIPFLSRSKAVRGITGAARRHDSEWPGNGKDK